MVPRCKSKTSLLIGLLLTGAFGAIAHAAVEAVPFRIEETRVGAFGDDKVSRSTRASLKLTLTLSGPEAESFSRYGNLKLETAVDDKGTSLRPAKDTFHDATKFSDYSNAFFRKSSLNPGHPAAPQIELDLALPSRAATKIAELKGSFELADTGTQQAVEVASLKNAGKKALAIPAGANVNVSIDVPAGDNARSIGITVTGDENALESIEIFDAAGQKVSTGMSSFSFNGGPVQKSLDLRRPLDDTMKLVAKILLNRKIVQVPFDLKDIALP